MVSAGAIAGVEHKRIFAGNYQAQAVDMEAFAVADVARVYNVPCIAVKVISDEYDFPMPPMGRFVGDSGEFKTGGFIAYTVVRPWLWPTVIKLGSNSALATERLCEELTIPESHLVAALIRKTKTHVADEDADAKVLIDADLAILGASEPAYRTYAQKIRQEYGWVPELEYRSGRRRILERVLTRPRIYHFLSHLEDPARRNLAAEIVRLAVA